MYTFSAGAKVSTDGVGAVSKDVTRPVLALVVVRHVAALAAVAVVAVTLSVQASSMFAVTTRRVTAVVWKLCKFMCQQCLTKIILYMLENCHHPGGMHF